GRGRPRRTANSLGARRTRCPSPAVVEPASVRFHRYAHKAQYAPRLSSKLFLPNNRQEHEAVGTLKSRRGEFWWRGKGMYTFYEGTSALATYPVPRPSKDRPSYNFSAVQHHCHVARARHLRRQLDSQCRCPAISIARETRPRCCGAAR